MILKNRLAVKESLSREDQARYYSAWYFTAIHFLLTTEDYRTREAIAKRLSLPLKKVTEVLEFLVSIGLAIQDGGKFSTGTKWIHLASDSPMITKHHTNWRMQTIQALDRDNPQDLHYSSVITIARDDAIKIKSALVAAIEQVRSAVKGSKTEEDLYTYSMDFFKV